MGKEWKRDSLPYMSPPEMFDGENWVLVKMTHLYEYEERVSAAIEAEQQRLRQVFLTIAEMHGLSAGAVLLFEVAIRDTPSIVDPTPEPPDA